MIDQISKQKQGSGFHDGTDLGKQKLPVNCWMGSVVRGGFHTGCVKSPPTGIWGDTAQQVFGNIPFFLSFI